MYRLLWVLAQSRAEHNSQAEPAEVRGDEQ